MNTEIDLLEYELYLLQVKVQKLYKDLFDIGKNKKSYLMMYLKILGNKRKKDIYDLNFQIKDDVIKIYKISMEKDNVKNFNTQLDLYEFINFIEIQSQLEVNPEIKKKWKYFNKWMISYKTDLENEIIYLKDEIRNNLISQSLILNKLTNLLYNKPSS